MNLILPSNVASELAYARARDEFNATLAANVEHVTGVMRDIDRRLRRIDPKLRLIYWPHNRPDVPLHKGYFYIWRDNSDRGAPATWIEIHDGEGNPCLPVADRVFEIVAKSDLWNPAIIRQHLIDQRRALARAEAERARADAERQEHLRDLVNAATRVSIGFHDVGKGWAQNQDGRRRTRKDRP